MRQFIIFSNLFKVDCDPELYHLDCINQLVSHDDNFSLCKIPNEEEVKEAIFDMNRISSPGPDGFGGAFYQSCFEIIKGDLVNLVQYFFSGQSYLNFIPAFALFYYQNLIILALLMK